MTTPVHRLCAISTLLSALCVAQAQPLAPANADQVFESVGATNKKDNPMVLPLKLSVVNVLKLRIIVASGDLLDLGKHATLAEAQVSK